VNGVDTGRVYGGKGLQSQPSNPLNPPGFSQIAIIPEPVHKAGMTHRESENRGFSAPRGGKPFDKGASEAASDLETVDQMTAGRLYGWHTVAMALQKPQRRNQKADPDRKCRPAAGGKRISRPA